MKAHYIYLQLASSASLNLNWIIYFSPNYIRVFPFQTDFVASQLKSSVFSILQKPNYFPVINNLMEFIFIQNNYTYFPFHGSGNFGIWIGCARRFSFAFPSISCYVLFLIGYLCRFNRRHSINQLHQMKKRKTVKLCWSFIISSQANMKFIGKFNSSSASHPPIKHPLLSRDSNGCRARRVH